MGVMHHSNYIRVMENARVDWMRETGLTRHHLPYGPMVLAVTKVNVEFKRPCVFDEVLEVDLEGEVHNATLKIRYAIWSPRLNAWAAFGATEHAFLTAQDLKPRRFPREFIQTVAKQPGSLHEWPPARS